MKLDSNDIIPYVIEQSDIREKSRLLIEYLFQTIKAKYFITHISPDLVSVVTKESQPDREFFFRNYPHSISLESILHISVVTQREPFYSETT